MHLIADTWPVNDILSLLVAKSQNLIVRSDEPEAKNSFVGSIAKQRTHPLCPDMTLLSLHFL